MPSSRKAVHRPAVAVFIDLENIRYGFLNTHNSEPDFQFLIEEARDQGSVTVAYAYADFTRQPERVRRQLETLGVTCRDVPLREFITSDGERRSKSSADVQMILDIVETALDRPQVKTFILGTGDSDFLRIVTMLRNRFGKDVTVAGVPRTTSSDLIKSATFVLQFEVPEDVDLDPESPTLKGLVWLLKSHAPRIGFWTYRQIDSWANQPWNNVPGDQVTRTNMLNRMLRDNLITQRIVETGEDSEEKRSVRISELNEEHEIVQQILANGQPATSDEGASTAK